MVKSFIQGHMTINWQDSNPSHDCSLNNFKYYFCINIIHYTNIVICVFDYFCLKQSKMLFFLKTKGTNTALGNK